MSDPKVTSWGTFGADTYRLTDPSKPLDLSPPPTNAIDVCLLTTADNIQCRIYVDTTAMCTMILYHNPTKNRPILYFRITRKNGDVHRGSSAVNPCRPGEVKKNSISSWPCSTAEFIDKAAFDSIK